MMPKHVGNIGSTESAINKEQSDTWQSVGNVAERLKSKCIEAMNLGQFETAEAYHEKLVEQEVNANERLVRR